MKLHIKKGILCSLAAGVFCMSICAQALFGNFNDISLVQVGDESSDKGEMFIIGENIQTYTAKRWVTPFKINKYETTYKLWYTVRILAESRGYVFGNLGQEGSNGKRGKEPTQVNCYQPVTNINWYDAVIWCNALSELEGRTPCYSYDGEVLRNSTDTALIDMCSCDWDADGYRLPTEAEWEYAARKTAAGFQNGSHASGQIDLYGNDTEYVKEGDVAWYSRNSDSTHVVGTAGTPFSAFAPPSPGDGYSNGLRLYDMSGNVLEFCWDWEGDYEEVAEGERAVGPEVGYERISRGGSWSPYTLFISCGDRFAYDPNEAYNFMGFRFCTSH